VEATMGSADVSAAFAQRMAQMQSELAEMQKVEQSVNADYGKSQKLMSALQNELSAASKQLTSAEQRRSKLERELKQCNDEIVGLKDKKEQVEKKIYEVTASAEKKKADKLRALGLGAPMPAVQPSQNAAKAPSMVQPSQTNTGSDLLGGLGDLDFNSSQAVTTDLIGSSDVFSAPPAAASSTAHLGDPNMFSTQQQAPAAPTSGAAQLGANLDFLYKQSAAQAQAVAHPGGYNAYGGMMPVGGVTPGGMQGGHSIMHGMMMPTGGIAPGSMQGGAAGAYASMPAGPGMGVPAPPPVPSAPSGPAQPDAQFLSLLGMGNAS